MKLVLLGDSIFDNSAYVERGGDVITKMNERLLGLGEALLIARDGAVIADVTEQVSGVPKDTTHLALSVGGNDALRASGVLAEPTASVAHALLRLDDVRERFEKDYQAMLDKIAVLQRPTLLCTIYDSNFPDPLQRRVANIALASLNDIILREAARRSFPIMDLRVMFDQPADYANAIEPSAQGAAKMADVMKAVLLAHDFAGPSALWR